MSDAETLVWVRGPKAPDATLPMMQLNSAFHHTLFPCWRWMPMSFKQLCCLKTTQFPSFTWGNPGDITATSSGVIFQTSEISLESHQRHYQSVFSEYYPPWLANQAWCTKICGFWICTFFTIYRFDFQWYFIRLMKVPIQTVREISHDVIIW